MRGNVEWWSELNIVNMGILKIKHGFIAGLVDETLQGKLNTNGHRDKDGNTVDRSSVLWLK